MLARLTRLTRLTPLAPLAALLACQAPTTPPAIHTWTSGPEGFDTRSHWVDTGDQVIVFDAQFTPALAEQLLAEIRARTDAPIGAVVITHPNPDKFLGAPVFQAAGARLIASEATAAALPEVYAYKKAFFVGAGMFTDDTFPALPTIDATFADTLELAPEITLHRLDHAGVTTTQTVARVGDDLIVGDLVAGRAHAWLEGGIVDGVATPDLASWKAALAELPELAGGDVYPGRGDVLPVDLAVAEQIDYLDRMSALVDGYLDDLDDPTAALTGADADAHYAAITAAAEAAFPGHALAYLITYGVYGLALQRAAE